MSERRTFEKWTEDSQGVRYTTYRHLSPIATYLPDDDDDSDIWNAEMPPTENTDVEGDD